MFSDGTFLATQLDFGNKKTVEVLVTSWEFWKKITRKQKWILSFSSDVTLYIETP